MLDVLLWRFWQCPRDLESAARDLYEQNPERVRAGLADPDSWDNFYVTDFKRRIAYTYGLAAGYSAHTQGKWRPGWNRWLLAAAGPDPEKATEMILRRVVELAKLHWDACGHRLFP